ncbi:MAG: hypothetical protein ACTTIC_00695 [Helicobacteraceae bacterium]
MYEVLETDFFHEWLANLKDRAAVFAIVTRLKRLSAGNFGDHKGLGAGL